MSWLADFGKQAAADALEIGSAVAQRKYVDERTTTAESTPGADAVPAGQPAAGYVATDARNGLDDPANIVLFGLPINKKAAAIGLGALALAGFFKLVRG